MNNSSDILLESRGLVKSFPGGLEGEISVLSGIDFKISRGETVSIRGESGSGKSTLLNVLSGLETAESGDLLWNGESVSKRTLSWLDARRAKFIGFVFQAYYLAP
ncbi:MAG: ATP-binding cassette domain-containing protein, partial [Opitutales bacterium]|nr:ATP-binding cassette domain-containing protein [Opitutales bacterium]